MDIGMVFVVGVGIIGAMHLAVMCGTWLNRRLFARIRDNQSTADRKDRVVEWYCFFDPSVFVWGIDDSVTRAGKIKSRSARINAEKKEQSRSVRPRKHALLRS